MNHTKDKVIKSLVNHYGKNWKTPLAKELCVNVSTIKRIFNQREEVPIVYQMAIKWITGE